MRGFWAKLPSFFFLTMDRTEEAMGGAATLGPWPWGHGGGREVGENGEEAEGVRFPYSPRSEPSGLWRAGDGGGRRWPAMAVAAALQTWGGGKRW